MNIDLKEPQPLILDEFGSKIIEPQVYPDLIMIKNDHRIRLSCTGSYLLANNTKFSDLELLTCYSGLFLIRNNLLQFSQFSCNAYPENIVRYSDKACAHNSIIIEIGFKVSNRFLNQIDLCFDKHLQTTLYSHFSLSPSIRGKQIDFYRPAWINDDVYRFGIDSVNTLYTKKRQTLTVNKLLGLPSDSTKIINPSSNYYLARGHLTAKSDFVFGVQQLLTFHLVNAAPQWQVFNAGNWLRVEQAVRNYAISNNVILDVYTGQFSYLIILLY